MDVSHALCRSCEVERVTHAVPCAMQELEDFFNMLDVILTQQHGVAYDFFDEEQPRSRW